MDIQKLNQAIDEAIRAIDNLKEVVNKEQINADIVIDNSYPILLNLDEEPVTINGSGEPLFETPQDINTIIDKCVEIFQNNPNSKGYAEVEDLNLDCDFPLNGKSIDKPITVIYGNLRLGVRHIIDRHGLEFDSNHNAIGVALSEDAVIQALKDLSKALKQGKFLIDFDLNGVNEKVKNPRKRKLPLPLGDRVIVDYNGFFYIILIAGFDGVSDVTCPLTIFKPNMEYKGRIEKLNKVYKFLH